MVPMTIERAIRKAQSSACREKVSAIAFDYRGNLLACSRNNPRFVHKGGSVHAEMQLFRRYGERIKFIVLCRTNKSGDLLPIHPCRACSKKAEKLGIKIINVFDFYGGSK